MSSEEEQGSDCGGCLCVIFGVPGAGKTALVDALVEERPGLVNAEHSINLVVVHFDNMYPLDLRGNSTEPQVQGPSGAHFDLKAARESINSCLEHYISHYLPSASEEATAAAAATKTAPPPPPHPDRWEEFLTCGVSGQHPPLLDRPTAVVVDDNLPLRSMRQHYHHMARKYGLGFAEVCVTCSLATALKRNSTRPIPIPDSTIIDMERKLELPDPFQYHWEERSVTLTNNESLQNFITSARQRVFPLLLSAIASPVPPPASKVDPQLQEMSRSATLDSFVHQADILLRKCVSECLAAARLQDKPELAGLANAVRRRLLAQVRAGSVGELELASGSVSATSAHFSGIVQRMFAESMYANKQAL